ncbi:MAG: helicase, partial [Spirochaetaceae bacterium]|nr:helicase [Spirochaetaceae bacterium]
QKDGNSNTQNQFYPKLESKIADTYVALSNATNKNSTYDSYIKAFRWASDRLNKTDGGVIAFVSNGAWLDGNAQDGFRKTLESEFSSIYVFNLRGNQRTSGELSRKEGGKIFGSGSRTPIAITILVRKPNQPGKAKIFYHDIGDYLSREDKLKIISDFHDVSKLPFIQLSPNEHGDWISQRNDKFDTWIPIGDKENKTNNKTFFVPYYGRGLATSRDVWCYNSSKKQLVKNINSCIDFYNSEVDRYLTEKKTSPDLVVNDFINYDSTKFSWDRNQRDTDLPKGRKYSFDEKSIRNSVYRPFFKQYCYFNRQLNNCVYQLPQFLPNEEKKNIAITVNGLSSKKGYSCLVADSLIDLNFQTAGTQCFPLYWYETIEPEQNSLFNDNAQIIKHEAISDFILEHAQGKYGNKVQREDIFYYVYGILHSKSYRETFEADLKKMLPRIPLVSDYQKFWAFSKAERDLANLHLNYEKVEAYPDVKVESSEQTQCKPVKAKSVFDDGSLMVAESESSYSASNSDEFNYYAVEKMKFPKKDQKDTIIYNRYHTITNIPEKAYEYVVNGKSAIEWVMERYQVTTDQKSGITNNPNDWSREHNKPRYILDLLLSVINVSVQTVNIVNNLPEVDWEKE